MHRLLIVDDEEAILNALKRELAREPYELTLVSDPEKAINLVHLHDYDLVLSDYRMPIVTGVDLLSEVRRLKPETARMILSGYSDLDALMGAINDAEIYRFISKPWQSFELKSAIQQALDHYGVIRENRRLADEVRAQRAELDWHARLLQKLEAESPGITKVEWAADGSIIMNEDDAR